MCLLIVLSLDLVSLWSQEIKSSLKLYPLFVHTSSRCDYVVFGFSENQFIYCFFKKLCQLKRFDCSVFPFGEIICKQYDFFVLNHFVFYAFLALFQVAILLMYFFGIIVG